MRISAHAKLRVGLHELVFGFLEGWRRDENRDELG